MRNIFPLVTICIPVYNGSRFLQQCMESAISQDYPNIEILVLDDCSTDNSMSVIEKYANLHPKIRVCQNLQNTGLVGNWNRCLELAKGEWIQFMFQDDYFTDKDSIGKAMAELLKTACELVIFDRNYIFEPGVPELKKQYYEDHLLRIKNYYQSEPVVLDKDFLSELFRFHFYVNFIGEPIVGIFSKNLVERYGKFDDEFAGICDFEFWLRICTNQAWLFMPLALVNFRVHQESESARIEKTACRYTDIISMFNKIILNDGFKNLRTYLGNRNAENSFEKEINELFSDLYSRKGSLYKLLNAHSVKELNSRPALFPRPGFKFIRRRLKYKLGLLFTRSSKRAK